MDWKNTSTREVSNIYGGIVCQVTFLHCDKIPGVGRIEFCQVQATEGV